MSMIVKTNSDTLSSFFAGHKVYESAEGVQKTDIFSPELADFCNWFLSSNKLNNSCLLSGFILACKTQFYSQREDAELFRTPTVLANQCLPWTPYNQPFIESDEGSEINALLSSAAHELTKRLNDKLCLHRKVYFNAMLEESITDYSLSASSYDVRVKLTPKYHESQLKNLSRLLAKLEMTNALTRYSYVTSLVTAFEFQSLELARDLLAVHLITQYQFYASDETYTYSNNFSYTSRKLSCIEGAFEKIYKAVLALQSVNQGSPSPTDDSKGLFDDIYRDFCADIVVTPFSEPSEEELS